MYDRWNPGAVRSYIQTPILLRRNGRRDRRRLALPQSDDVAVDLDVPMPAKGFGDASRSRDSGLRDRDLAAAARAGE